MQTQNEEDHIVGMAKEKKTLKTLTTDYKKKQSNWYTTPYSSLPEKVL